MSSRRAEGSPARLLWEVAFLVAFLAAATAWADRPWLMLGAVAAILILRFALIGTRSDVLYLVLGVVLGGGNDLLSIVRGVYAYDVAHPGLPWPIPLWMLLFWGQVFCLMRTVFDLPWLRGPGASRPLWPPGAALTIDLVALVAMRLVVYRTYAHPVVPGVTLAAILVLTYVLHGITATDVKVMAVTAVAGPLVEWVLVSAGVYSYVNPVILGMPVWLLVWWVFATPLLKRIFDRIEYEAEPRFARVPRGVRSDHGRVSRRGAATPPDPPGRGSRVGE